MAFKLRSGNTSSFKQMGSSPVKAKSSSGPNMNDPKDEKTRVSTNTTTPVTPPKVTTTNNKDGSYTKSDGNKSATYKPNPNYNPKSSRTGNYKYITGEKNADGTPIGETHRSTSKSSPAKQKLNKGGEGQDQDKIFNAKGIHVGDYVNGKKVMHHEQQHKKIVKSSKSAHGQLGDAKRDFNADVRNQILKLNKLTGLSKEVIKTVTKSPDTRKDKLLKSKSPAKQVNPKDPKAIKGKHYPDKAMVEKLKKGPYTKGGQNASSKANFNTKGVNNYTKTNAAGNRVDMMGNEHTAKARANRNAIGAPKKKAATPKGFNVKGGKTTTPGYSTTKAAKKVSKASKFIKGAKKVLKVGGKIAGGLGVAGTLYDMYKSGQEHSGGKAVKGQKSFMADAKKNTKSIFKKK